MRIKDLGLKCGLEIHIQLDTKHKLFCNCSTAQRERTPIKTIVRKLHPVASELGEIDVAAQFEYLRDRTFYYQVFKNENCEVELDEEPPHEVNKEALEIALQIALLLNCKIPDEIHVMRKTVIDGSNISGFQRTMIVGEDGYITYKKRKIPIAHVCLEEDAAAIIKEEDGKVYYRLNRLGIPLIEISTGILENFTPKEIEEIAYNIWLICKSTGKIKEEIGSVRQDVNVSIKGGARIEVKGIQRLGLISKVIENEINRQLKIIQQGEKVKEETRAAREDGTTYFTRPLPGAARMYPETDIPPVIVGRNYLINLRKKLPEPLNVKIERFVEELKLSKDLARQIATSRYLELFEKISKKVEPSIVASFFVYTLKDLERRKEIKPENLKDEHFIQVFDLLARGKIVKEALPEIFIYLSKNPKEKIKDAIEKLGLKILTKRELEKIIKETINKNRQLPKEKVFGIIMSKVRGRAKINNVRKVFEKMWRT
jgi:Glu-tRNA(Gln) amidotransferase subunit E-like FAD-binding protein